MHFNVKKQETYCKILAGVQLSEMRKHGMRYSDTDESIGASRHLFDKSATDVTEFAVCDNTIYRSPVIGLHNNR